MRPGNLCALSVALVMAFAAPQAGGGAGRTVEISAAAGLETVATSRDLSIVLPKRFFRSEGRTEFSIPYLAELWYRVDGGSWQSHRLYKELDKPMEFTAGAEGRYDFFVTLWDERGNADAVLMADTPPQISVLFDWTAPEVRLGAPAGGELLGGGTAVDIQWDAFDAFFDEKPITIEYSEDGGRSWRPIASRIANTGTFAWSPPAGVDMRVLVRVTAVDDAGQQSTDVTRSPLIIDTAAPTAAVLGPTLSASEEVRLEIRSDDAGGSGVANVQLWVTLDNGATWAPAGSFDSPAEAVFRSTTGRYGLNATAADRAGNVSPRPRPGDAPQTVLTIDTKAPIVRLHTLNTGGTIAGGSQVPLQWEAVSPRPVDRPVSIFLSPDGGNSWAPIASELANTGTFLWEVPKINTQAALLKITLTDASGAVGSAHTAKPFTIDSAKPVSAIGVAPGAWSAPPADLSAVIKPVMPSRDPQVPATASPTVPTPRTGRAPTADDTAGARGAEVAPTPPPSPPRGPIELPEGVVYTPSPTPAPSEPWEGPREAPFTLLPPASASFEDVLKAGYAAYQAEQLPIAKEHLRRAAEMDAADARPRAMLGKIYAREGQSNYSSRMHSFQAALYEFEKALSLGGPDADVYNNMGVIFLQTRRLKDARQAFATAAELGAKSIYFLNLGQAHFELQDTASASEAFTKALEIEPGMKEACFFMGRICAGQGRWQEARENWAAAVDGYGPDSSLGRIALAGLQTAREKLGEVEPAPVDNSLRQKMDRIR